MGGIVSVDRSVRFVQASVRLMDQNEILAQKVFEDLCVAHGIDPEAEDAEEQLNRASETGINGIHPFTSAEIVVKVTSRTFTSAIGKDLVEIMISQEETVELLDQTREQDRKINAQCDKIAEDMKKLAESFAKLRESLSPPPKSGPEPKLTSDVTVIS